MFNFFQSYTGVFIPVIQNFAALFDIFGIILVFVGALAAFWSWIQAETGHHGDKDKRRSDVSVLRMHFGQKMVLGLEFFLAGDLLRLITTPTFEVLTRVGVVLVIRTILAYFLAHEMRYERGG